MVSPENSEVIQTEKHQVNQTHSSWGGPVPAKPRISTLLTCMGKNSRISLSESESKFYLGREKKSPGHRFLDTESGC